MLVMSNRPPCKLDESPIAATETSILDPGWANGGSVAVTMAAAVLRTRMKLRIYSYAHLLEHVCQTLSRENRLPPVARPIQPDDNAVTD